MSQNVVLSCPSCATRFSAPLDQFIPNGRQVRCSQCQHIWFHPAPVVDTANEPSGRIIRTAPVRAEPAAVDHEPPPPPEPEREKVRDHIEEQGTERSAESERHQTATFQPERPRASRRRSGVLSWLLWLIALLLLAAILAYIFREPLRRALPQYAPMLDRYTSTVDNTARGLIGETAEPYPLKFRNIHYDVNEYDGDKEILVEADLVNTSGRDMPAPMVRVRVVDADRAPLHASVIGPEDMSDTIAAGASARYFVRIPEPPPDFESVLLNIEEQ